MIKKKLYLFKETHKNGGGRGGELGRGILYKFSGECSALIKSNWWLFS
jgi:hypothetical protein